MRKREAQAATTQMGRRGAQDPSMVPPAAPVPALRLQGIRKNYGSVVAVAVVDLVIEEGEFFTLLGPSGSGKTTLLRMIAGFERPDAGRIELGGRDVTSLPPHLRDTNTVFQDYALFPHMSVGQNIGYGLRIKHIAGAERQQRVDRALRMVRLEGLGKRRPNQLSGPRGHQPARGPAPRRAPRRPRPEAAPGDADRAEADPERGRHHLRLRDARPGGGPHDERPGRGHVQWADRADRDTR